MLQVVSFIVWVFVTGPELRYRKLARASREWSGQPNDSGGNAPLEDPRRTFASNTKGMSNPNMQILRTYLV